MNNSVGKNNRHVRNLNRIGIIALLRDYGSLTKAEIAAKMNLTFTAVNNLVEELMRDRLIAEAGFYDESSRGRKPKLLSLNSGDIYAVGVHISASSVRAAVINLQGKAMMEKRSIFEDNANRGSVVNVIISTIQAVLDESGLKSQIIGIGVGAPGPLDPVQGKILSPPNLPGLHQVRLKGLIEENTELPTQIEKDANVMALGELWYGNGRHFSNLVYVDADIGIGSGLIFNQKIYQGYPFGAGEIGHCTIDIDGPRCNCGNYGCLEAIASGIAIVRRVGEELRRGAASSLKSSFDGNDHGLDVTDVITAGLEGDQLAANMLNESARYVGISLANVINLLTPETIIIGGVLANRYPDFFKYVKETSYNRSLSSFHNKIVLQPSELGELAGIIGAGTIVLEKFLNEMSE
ncbi:ROK family protein [Paenibacillus lautus]|uniref:ROK family transcriptional regulator n=1 Tax=Paenibacillus lautus TaxID=1401 RepID=A0A385TIS9_PAELA|nr:ROK family protein [Paenibacillus lautus]AYB43563.1 ROK family transcriptional regulator [Paenibacillus lautus]VTR58152.1 ROK family protein [Actinobacillus pleuropneumoniae]